MRAPIHSDKHYVQMSLTTVTTGAEVDVVLIDAQEGTVANQVFEVVEGAVVKAIFVELWCIGSVNDQFFTIILQKLSSGATPASITQMAALGTYTNKKNILYTTQGLASNDGIGDPMPVIRQWFKIPKGKQRFGLGDKMVIQVASRGDANIVFCGFATYKEYT